jgi:hypothetical protein
MRMDYRGHRDLRTLRIVEMKTEFAFERQRKVVFGLACSLALRTARFIAGCCNIATLDV